SRPSSASTRSEKSRTVPPVRRSSRAEPATPLVMTKTQAPAEAPAIDEYFEARMDAILEKMTRSGRASLTTEEEAFLVSASERLKKKRLTEN
ncbi:MAG: hypothetical protein ACRCZF_10225, partial [Gemmataceae bacterium]